MNAKDLFSGHAHIYAAFRPVYPPELYDFLFQHVPHRSTAWDCATGNGQVAHYLSRYFEKVYATDISPQQIGQASSVPNIIYSVASAESTSFAPAQFDLITVAQALHWINTNEFYQEVKRVAKPEAMLAVWGYSNLSINPAIDKLFHDFYYNTVGPYWDSARKLVEEEYQQVPFPFEQIPCPKFQIKVAWSLDQFAGYLRSWSATQKYILDRQQDPVTGFMLLVQREWKEVDIKEVVFPVFMKLGRIFS
jgi:hypothetical protein